MMTSSCLRDFIDNDVMEIVFLFWNIQIEFEKQSMKCGVSSWLKGKQDIKKGWKFNDQSSIKDDTNIDFTEF